MIAKIYTDDQKYNSIPTPTTPQPPIAFVPQQPASQQQPTLPQPTRPQSTLQQQSDPGINKLFMACQEVPVKAYNSIGVG